MLARGAKRQFGAVVMLCAAAFAVAACTNTPSGTKATGTSSSRSGHPTTTSSTTRSTGGSETKQVVFRPFSENGQLLSSLEVTQTVTGSCVSPGAAGDSSYRCFAQPGTTVYDPCFAPPRSSAGPLACVADPAMSQVVDMNVTSLPAAAPRTPPTQTWAMRLSTGQVCVLVSAAWGELGPFACPVPASSGPSVADCHSPTRSQLSWQTDCQTTESADSPFNTFSVLAIWT